MQRFLFSIGMIVGLVACSKTPPAAEVPAAPAAAESAPPPTPSAPPAAEKAAAGDAGTPHGRKSGGKCEYEDVPGTGTVTKIEKDSTAGPDCKDAKKVTVTFAPDDAKAKPMRGDPGFTLEVGGVGFVATGCLKEQKIAVGTKLRVVRHHELAGGCTPLVYEVTTLSSPEAIEKCTKYCR